MPMVNIAGKEVEVDEEGYLVDLSQWNEDIAKYMAVEEKVDLTDSHWEVVNFLREYYAEYQIAPAVRVLTKAIGKKLGPEKGNNRKKATTSSCTSCSPTAPPSRLVRSRVCPSRPAVSKL